MTKWSWLNVKIIIIIGVYLTRGLSGPNPKPNGLGAGQPGLKSVQPTTSWTHVYTRRGRPRWWRKAVEAVPPYRWAMCLGRPVDRHLVSYHLSQVSGAPPRPYKYPPSVEIRTYTPLLGNFTCKALILSVIARHRLVGRVVRLWGPLGLSGALLIAWAWKLCWNPSRFERECDCAWPAWQHGGFLVVERWWNHYAWVQGIILWRVSNYHDSHAPS
jgi:hypothetical protein